MTQKVVEHSGFFIDPDQQAVDAAFTEMVQPFGLGLMTEVDLTNLPIASNGPDTFTGNDGHGRPTDTDPNPSGGD